MRPQRTVNSDSAKTGWKKIAGVIVTLAAFIASCNDICGHWCDRVGISYVCDLPLCMSKKQPTPPPQSPSEAEERTKKFRELTEQVPVLIPEYQWYYHKNWHTEPLSERQRVTIKKIVLNHKASKIDNSIAELNEKIANKLFEIANKSANLIKSCTDKKYQNEIIKETDAGAVSIIDKDQSSILSDISYRDQPEDDTAPSDLSFPENPSNVEFEAEKKFAKDGLVSIMFIEKSHCPDPIVGSIDLITRSALNYDLLAQPNGAEISELDSRLTTHLEKACIKAGGVWFFSDHGISCLHRTESANKNNKYDELDLTTERLDYHTIINQTSSQFLQERFHRWITIPSISN